MKTIGNQQIEGKIVATIEARMKSTRLPGKVLLPLGEKPSLVQMYLRAVQSKFVDEVVIATTDDSSDDEIVEICKLNNIPYFRGSMDNVMSRVLETAKSRDADYIVELTGDCPLVDPKLVDELIEFYFNGKYDYVYNRLDKGLADGFDVQVFSTERLEYVSTQTTDPIDLVHVSCYFYNNPELFKIGSLKYGEETNLYTPDWALTLDEPEDYQLIKKVFEALNGDQNLFTAHDVIHYLKANPELMKINENIRRKDLAEG